MTWTKVTKPTTDDWSGVQKPSESSVITFLNNGEPFGLLIAITRDTQTTSIVTGWTDINKPTSSVWSFVSKPTT